MELYNDCKYITDKNEEEKFNLKNTKYKLFFLFVYLMIILKIKKNNYYKEELLLNDIDKYNNNNLMDFNKDCLLEYLNNSEYLRITFINYKFSFKYKIIKIEYYIGFYDLMNNLILPSNLT